MKRRNFLKDAGFVSAAAIASGILPASAYNTVGHSKSIGSNTVKTKASGRFCPVDKCGFGGVAIGNGFQEHADVSCLQALDATWESGVRYYDTSPWYGLGISERRLGLFLKDKERSDFTLSSKVGRLLNPHDNFQLKDSLWKGRLNFDYTYDYTAEGTRKSIEDSLQRLGVSSLDIVFIHDLSPDNQDMKADWLKYFEIAANGAMVELTKMRDEGLIKAWGLGVNTVEPIVKTMEVADPDIFLSACQYDLIQHQDALDQVFPKVHERDISVVVGAPLCAGFLAGKERYLYSGDLPAKVVEKRKALERVADNHQVDLRTAALQFCAAPDVVSAVIPGSHNVEQATANAASFKTPIPVDFWKELKSTRLIAENAPIPAVHRAK